MSSGHDADIQSHIKVYMMVFASLAVLTVVTVAASYLELSSGEAIFLALVIASVKGSLVACFFMHLISEKAFITWILMLTAGFFFILMFVPLAATLFPGACHILWLNGLLIASVFQPDPFSLETLPYNLAAVNELPTRTPPPEEAFSIMAINLLGFLASESRLLRSPQSERLRIRGKNKPWPSP